MLLAVLTTSAFERDVRRLAKQGKDLEKLGRIVDLLQAQLPLPPRCRLHPLKGEWIGHWDCHVEPDWLLLYRTTESAITLVRTGSHSELFRR